MAAIPHEKWQADDGGQIVDVVAIKEDRKVMSENEKPI